MMRFFYRLRWQWLMLRHGLHGPVRIQGYSGECGEWSLLHYHRPDSITWRWGLHYSPCRKGEKYSIWPSFGPSYNCGKNYFARKGHFGAWLRLPFRLGCLSISTQEHMIQTEAFEKYLQCKGVSND